MVFRGRIEGAELAVKLSGWQPESVLNMDETTLQDLLRNSAGIRDSKTTFKTKQPIMRFTLAPDIKDPSEAMHEVASQLSFTDLRTV